MDDEYVGVIAPIGVLNVHSASRQPHSAVRLALGALAGVVLAALLLLISTTTLHFGSPGFSSFVEDWVYDFITLAAALVTLGRAPLREEERLTWALLGIGLLSWAVGDLYTTVDVNAPFPSIGDVLYIAGYIPIFAGMIFYVRARVGRMTAVVWADVTMGALCVAAIGASLLMDFVLANTTGTPLEIAVAVAYPALDLVILAIAAGAVALTGWRPGRGLALVAAGVACAAIGDAVYTYQSLAGTYTTGAWNNFLWPLATVLIAAGALQPSPRHRETEPAEGWREFASPTIFALAVLALLMLERQDMTEPGVAALTVATLVALVFRLVLTFAQNRSLVIELETGSADRALQPWKAHPRPRPGVQLRRAASPCPRVPRPRRLQGLQRRIRPPRRRPAPDPALTSARRRRRRRRPGLPDGRRRVRDALSRRRSGRLGRGRGRRGGSQRTRRGLQSQLLVRHGDPAGGRKLPELRPPARGSADVRGQGFQSAVRWRRGGGGISQGPQPAGSGAGRARERGQGPGAGGREGARSAAGRALRARPRVGAPRRRQDRDPRRGPQQGRSADDEEWGFMRQHTILGERIVSAAPSLASVGSLIRSSHERWDGTGYPDGLSAEQIPLLARIIFACDAYDAMTAERPYSPALTSKRHWP